MTTENDFRARKFTEPEHPQPVFIQVSFDNPSPLPEPQLEGTCPEQYESPPEQWLQRVIQAILETLHGVRQPAQLRAVVTAPTLHALQQRRIFITAFKQRTVPRLVTLKYWNRTEHEIEVTGLCEVNNRYFPIALRLKQQATTWLVVACEIGPY